MGVGAGRGQVTCGLPMTCTSTSYSSDFHLGCINLCYQQPWVLFLLSISTYQSLKLCEAQEIQGGQLDRVASFLTWYSTIHDILTL